MGISIREYARQREITEGAVRKAIRSGRITTEPDGSIDIEKADQDWLANTRAPKLNIAKTTTPQQKIMITMPKSVLNLTKQTLAEHGQVIGDDEPVTQQHLRDATDILKLELMQIEIDERKGILINKARIHNQIFHLARQERDAWLTWPTRIANQMAAEKDDLNDPHQLQFVLERYVRDYICELGELTLNDHDETATQDDDGDLEDDVETR